MVKATVEITQNGRGGSVYYREGGNSIAFDWEFALSPVLAEIWGTKAKNWDQSHPWAAGRQGEIFDFVAQEVVRQKTDDCAFENDLYEGTITVFQLPAKFLHLRKTRLGSKTGQPAKRTKTKAPKSKSKSEHPSEAYKNFMAGMPPLSEQWRDDQTYDLASFRKMSDAERSMVVALLAARDVTWREVAVLAEDASPKSLAALEAATLHHLSIDTRIAAAEALDKKKRVPDLDKFLSRQIRLLDRPENGLVRALALAKDHPSETIKQALLWASYNSTDCAPHCARLLLKLTGAAKEPFAADVEQMLSRLGLHSSYFDRKGAFDRLCSLVKMELDQARYE
jgi:hypothetical protein